MDSGAFWDLSPSQRGMAYDWAEERYGDDFWDLTPAERGSAYDWALGHFAGRA